MKYSDKKAEQAVIGAIKKEPAIMDSVEILPQYFGDPSYKTIFRILRDMYEKKIEINDITFADYVQSKKIELTISTYVMIENATTANIGYYLGILKKIHALNQWHQLVLEIQDRLVKKDPELIAEFVEKYLTEMNTIHTKDLVTNQDFVMDNIKEFENRIQNKISKVLKTNVREIDFKIKGFDPGTVNILASRPSIGKTAFMLFLAYSMANSWKIGVFSLEMKLRQLHDRITAIGSGVNLLNIKTGDINSQEFERCMDGLRSIYDRMIYYDDTSYISFRELKSKIRKMSRYGVNVIFIDYLTLIKYKVRGVPRFERIGMLTKELKRIASDTGLCLIVLSQLGREAEDKEPTLANLRQSGEIEEDVDSVIFLHRKRDSDEMKVIVAKNRNGPVGRFSMIFERNTGRFKSYE